MKIYTAMVIVSDNDDGTGGKVHAVDVIEHGNNFWLVPEWLDYTSKGVSKPQRMISLETIPHTKHLETTGHQFLVEEPVPKSVFEGRTPEGLEDQYVVVEEPDVLVPQTH